MEKSLRLPAILKAISNEDFNFSQLNTGAIITIRYSLSSKVSNIKILAKVGELHGISRDNDIDSFDKWVTLSELKRWLIVCIDTDLISLPDKTKVEISIALF